MADLHGLVELDDLLDLRLDDLEFLGLHHVLDLLLQTAVVVLRNLHSREQVLQDGLQRKKYNHNNAILIQALFLKHGYPSQTLSTKSALVKFFKQFVL